MQTSYEFAMAPAFPGMLADATPHIVDSARNEEPGKIPFGIGLIRGTTDSDVKLPAAATDIIAGISVHTHAVDQRGFTGANDAIDTKGSVNILKWGRCRVLIEQPVVSTDPVFVRITPNGAGKLQQGIFRKDDDGGTAIRVRGIRFITSGTLTSPPMVQIDAGLIADHAA